MLKKILLFLLFAIVVQFGFSQTSLRLSDYINSYTKQMSDGTIWISSLNGINRYDGVKIKEYRPNPTQPFGLKEGLVQNTFYESEEGDVWFTTPNYLNKWERRTDRFHAYRLEGNIVNTSASDYRIIDLVGGCVYLLIDDGVYQWCNPTSGFELLYSGFRAIEFSLSVDDQGDLTHLYGTLWSYAPGVLHLYKEGENYQLDTLYQERVCYRITSVGDVLFVQCNDGISQISDKGTSRNIADSVNGMTASSECLYYMQSDSLMRYKDNQSKSIYRTKEAYNTINHISNSLFVGNDKGKSFDLFSIEMGVWKFYSSESDVSNGAKFDDHLTWTTDVGAVIKNRNGHFTKDVVLESSGQAIMPATTFSGGCLLGKNGALVESDYDLIDFPGPPLGNVYGGVRNKKGEYVISHNNGVRIIAKDLKIYKDYKIDLLSDVVYYDDKSRLFVQGHDSIFIFNVEAFDSNAYVASIAFDLAISQFFQRDDSTIVVGSNQGLHLLDLTTFTISPWKLQEFFVQTFTYDTNGILWFATSDALYKEKQDGGLSKYSEANGLPSHKFTHDCSLLGNDGMLYFGTSEGILYFHPEDVVEAIYDPPMMLTSFRIHGSEWGGDSINVEVIDEVTLDYNENTMTFDFVAIDYDENSMPQYSVYLDGFDSDTIYLQDQSRITYPNIAPGEYTFYYGACTLSGYCKEEYKQLKVSVRPPYWQTWWFRLLVILGILGLLTLGVVLYLRNKLREQRYAFEKQELILKTELQLQQERNRIADELHDELGGKLSSIKFASKKVERADNLNDVKHITHRVSEISTELIDSMRSIIWAMDTQNDTYESLTAYIRSYISNMSRDNDIAIKYEPVLSDVPINIKGQIRHHLSLTIKEIINNIVKHAEASMVIVQSEIENETLVVTIYENGKGFDPEGVESTGKGLRSIRKRMKTVHGELSYTCSEGMLTRIQVPLA